MKEARLNASYTTKISDYQVFDKDVDEQIKIILNYLPKKEEVVRYEYHLRKQMYTIRSNYLFSMYVQTTYDSDVYEHISNSELMKKTEDITDQSLSQFECYELAIIENLESKDCIVGILHILFNEEDNITLYAVTNNYTNIFEMYDNNFYIGAFLNGYRDNPYYIYKTKKS